MANDGSFVGEGRFEFICGAFKSPEGQILIRMIWIFQNNQMVLSIPIETARNIANNLLVACDQAENTETPTEDEP